MNKVELLKEVESSILNALMFGAGELAASTDADLQKALASVRAELRGEG